MEPEVGGNRRGCKMSNISQHGTVTPAERGREFWCGVLLAGGFTALPRWTLEPVPGVGEHEARIPDELVAGLRRRANELALPLGSVLLAAHAKVLGVLSGEREVSTGYTVGDSAPLPCRMTIGAPSWRALLLEADRAASELLSYRDFPVDELRRELGLTKPSFETVFDPTAGGGALADQTVLWIGIAVPDRRARRSLGRPDCRLSPRRARAHRRRSRCRARAPEPALRGGTALPARGPRRTTEDAAGPPGSRAVRGASAGAPGRRRGRARRPAVDLPAAQRSCQSAGTTPVGAG